MMSAEVDNLFKSLAPDMMKDARLLIVDHDVTRYHSFDLLRYLLYKKAAENDFAGFSSLNPAHSCLAKIRADTFAQVYHMKNKVKEFNVFECFAGSKPMASEEYASALREMFLSPYGKVTETDIGIDFGTALSSDKVTGFLLRQKGDPHMPQWPALAGTYESDNIFNVKTIEEIMRRDRINAIMISSVRLAVELALRIAEWPAVKPVTFIVGRYGYNFAFEGDTAIYPLCAAEIDALQLKHRHEFGFYEPFGNLTRYIRQRRITIE